jgi:transposase
VWYTGWIGTHASNNSEIRAIIAAALLGRLDHALAARAYELGREATIALTLAVNARMAELTAVGAPAPGPHTPSGAIPVYTKQNSKKTRRSKPPRPGARTGHEGHRRAAPITIDRHETVPDAPACPECRGPVLPSRPNRRRKRTIEDIPPTLRVEAVEYDIPQQWCPCCKKHVEPAIPGGAAMPGATLGNGIVALTTVMHYGLGLTIDQTREVFASHLRTPLSAGGLVDLWRRAGTVLLPWYEEIGQQAKASATLHADETGWRVNGDTHWLWCFCNHLNCYYLIDESRGSDVLRKFFTSAFGGVLMSDFWGPYQSVLLEGEGARQCCLAHLLRELDHVDEHDLPHKPPDRAKEWSAFVKMLRRLLRDGIRLRKRKDYTPERYASRLTRIDTRLIALAEGDYDDPDAARLAKRLSRHRDELFTFLDRPEADWNNNFAERQIRPAVILRKNSQCNRSQRGAATQAVLMSIYRTLKLRGLDPRAEIEQALRHWSATGLLPPLPTRTVAVG